jgi:hypothetical protein
MALGVLRLGLLWPRLLCPAVDYGQMGIDSCGQCVKSGASCFCETFDPMNWFFAPFLAVYAAANLLVLISPLLILSSPDGRCVAGVGFVVFFVFSLAAPWCANEVKGVYVGCVLWQMSLLAAGLGFLRLANADERRAK